MFTRTSLTPLFPVVIAAVAAAPGARVSAQTVIVNGFPMGGKLGVTLQDVTRKLAERAGIRIEEGMMSAEDEAKVSMRRRLLALHAEAADFFHQ